MQPHPSSTPIGKRPAGRQYVFRTRRDRQRIAHRLAAGMGAAEVAAVERCEMGDIDRLLGDTSFKKLLAMYEGLLDAPPETRRARLIALAEEILMQAVMAGNEHACAYVLHLTQRQEEPAASLVDAVERGLSRARAGRGPSRVRPGSLDGAPPADPRPVPEQDKDHRDYVAARAKVEARLVRTGDALRRKVVAEAERLGTAWAAGRLATRPIPEELSPMASPANEAAALGRMIQRRPEPLAAAQADLARRKAAYLDGQPVRPPDLAAIGRPPPPPPPVAPAPPRAPPPPPPPLPAATTPPDLATPHGRAKEHMRLQALLRGADPALRTRIFEAIRELHSG